MNYSYIKFPALLMSIFFCLGISHAKTEPNAKPFVIPELKEWKGKDGNFLLSQASAIVVNQDLLQVAESLADDWKTMFGENLPVRSGKGGKGDIEISVKKGLKLVDEGYIIEIGDKITITAKDIQGAYWATRSLLQIAEQTATRSFPKGKITDWPDYHVRGLSMDVGRKFFPLDYLEDLVKVMSYYKLNSLRVHLNDNGFPYYFGNDWDKTYSAFRMESDTYPGLTARDGYYTKSEFKEFQKMAASYFVDIMPEIDIPAHALAFSHYKPELGSKEFGMDHLNLFNEETIPFLDALFEEYLGGDDPVFEGPNMHIGTDEFGKDYPGFDNRQETIEKFRAFADHFIRLVESYGKQPWVWGSLSTARGETPVKTEGVMLDAWYNGYADPNEMIGLGFKLNSIPDGMVYIVPGAGYYHDYLDTRWLYNNWTPAVIGNVKFEEQDPNIVGGYFAVWNDHVGNGISVQDVHHRIMAALPTMATKLWDGVNVTLPYEDFEKEAKIISEAPGVNRLAKNGKKPGIIYEVATLLPGQTTPVSDLGYDWALEFDIESQPEEPGTILFSSPNSIFYLADPVKGMWGFARDGYLNTFNFKLYPEEKAHIKLTGDNKSTKLYVNGKLKENLDIVEQHYNGGKNKMYYHRTLMMPLEKTGDFKSKISNVKAYNYIPE